MTPFSLSICSPVGKALALGARNRGFKSLQIDSFSVMNIVDEINKATLSFLNSEKTSNDLDALVDSMRIKLCPPKDTAELKKYTIVYEEDNLINGMYRRIMVSEQVATSNIKELLISDEYTSDKYFGKWWFVYEGWITPCQKATLATVV